MFNLKKTIASFFTVLECLIFGLSFIAVKKLLDMEFPTFLLLFIRFEIGALFLLCFRWVSGVLNFSWSTGVTVSRFSKNDLTGGLLLGGVLFAAYAFQTLGTGITTPAKNGLLTGLFVVFVPIICFFQTKRIRIKPIVCALISLAGVSLLLDIFGTEIAMNWGDFFSIICGFLFAFYFVAMERYAQENDSCSTVHPLNFTIIQLSIVGFLSLLISLIFEVNHYSSVMWVSGIGWMLFLGICGSAIAYLFQFFAQSVISAETVSVLSCSEVVFATFFSLMFGYDHMTWQLGMGALLVLVAMVLTSISFNFHEALLNKDFMKNKRR